MAIGDDLFTMLGLIPARDRAGIARGTMADEAKASMAVNHSGNAEGRALVDGGARPPAFALPPQMGGDIRLPDDVGAEYASGKPKMGGGAVLPPALPPPQERIVASGPAANPPPEVRRNSDIIFEAMQKQAQQQRMMQIINGIGQMVSGATGHGGGGGVSAGGGAAGGGVGDLKALLDMRDAETTKIQMVDQAQRMFGLSKQDAEARYASGDLAKLFAPETIAKREADQRAARVRMDLSDPAVITQIAKITGTPEPVVKADIASGKIGQKEIADILHTQAQSGKLGAETVEQQRATGEAAKADRTYAFYQDHPEAFATLHGLKNVDEARRIVSDRKIYDKYQETSGPTAYSAEAGYAQAKREGYTGSREDWEKLGPSGQKDSPAEKGEAYSVQQLSENLGKEHKRLAVLQRDLSINQPIAQGLFRENQLGGSKMASMTLAGRKILGQMFLPEGTYDDKAVQAETFHAHLGQNVLAQAQAFPGALSNDDRTFLSNLSGNMEMTPQAIRNLMTIREKMARAELKKFNQDIEAHKLSPSKGMRGAVVPYSREGKPGSFDVPPPGKLLQEDFNRQGGAAALKSAAADGKLNDPEFVQDFEAQFGTDSLPFFMGKAGIKP